MNKSVYQGSWKPVLISGITQQWNLLPILDLLPISLLTVSIFST